MILDAFPFFNEYDMLQFRMKLLWDKVDKFVIVEADHTYSGKKKPWNFLENKERFSWALDKIIYHQYRAKNVWDGSNPPMHTDPNHPCWYVEYGQRDAVLEACKHYSDDDTLLLSDCDEIPGWDVFHKIDGLLRWDPIALQQHFFYYNLSCLRREQWQGTILTKLGTARRQGTQGLRNLRNSLQHYKSGWHLSYFTDTEGVQEKLRSFSHVEYNTPTYNSAEHIEECVKERKDLFIRGMTADKIDRTWFPDYFLKESDNFQWWSEE